MTSVERVKTICKERKIPISRLERDLGYGNGYIGQLRKGVLPDDRAREISAYFGVSVDYLLTGEDKSPEAGVTLGLDDFTYAMHNESGVLSDSDKEILLSMARQLSAARKAKNGEDH